MEKARNHYKNPNEIPQFINLPIYKGLLARCFLMLVEAVLAAVGKKLYLTNQLFI